MRVTAKAQVTIPKDVRERAGIAPGDEVEFGCTDGVVTIRHTEVPPALGGRGIAGRLVAAAFDWARAEGYKVRPACEYAAAWVRQNEELLPIGDADLGSQDFDIELRPAKAPVAAGAGATGSAEAEPDGDEFDVTLRREDADA